MSTIEFNDEPHYAQRPVDDRPHGLGGLVQKWGLAHNDRQAQYVLLGIAVLLGVVAVYIAVSFGTKRAPPVAHYAEGQSAFSPPEGAP